MMQLIRKEILELVRTGKFFIIMIIYVLFGIMNPLIAKLTPWMAELMTKSMQESGLELVDVTVNALTSWQQFFKNLPIALIVLVFIVGASYTNEYQKGTLVLVVTKGVKRWKIALSKYLTMIGLWTVCYMIMYGITYGYTAYYWDNGIAENLEIAVLFYWVFGCLILSFVQLASAYASSTAAVLLDTLGAVVIMYFLSLLATLKEYLPLQIANGYGIVTGAVEVGDCFRALIITIVICVICLVLSIHSFNKKMI